MTVFRRLQQRWKATSTFLMGSFMLLFSSSAFAQQKWGQLMQDWANANIGGAYYLLVAVFALGGFALVGLGFYGLYARNTDPQNWKMGKSIGAILIGGALLVVPYLAFVGAETATDGNVQERPFFAN